MQAKSRFLALIAVTGMVAASALADVPHYKVLKRFPLAGDGGWDYMTVDSPSHRLFISRGTHVQVMDVTNGKLVGDIANTPGVHGIAIDRALRRGYTSNGRENTVTVFDLMSLKEVARIKVTGENPDAILFDSATNRVFTFNGRTGNATAIDVKTNSVVGTIKLNGKPEFPQADGMGTVFVNIEDTSEVQQIDAKALKVVKTWKIAPAEGPSGMSIDLKHHRTFSTCDGLLAISDTKAGKLAQTAKIGDGPDAAGFDPAFDVAFSSNGGDGTLSVVARKSNGAYETVQNLPTQKSARTMALDAKSHRIYLIGAEFQAPAPGSRRGQMKPNSAVIIVVGPA
ncbi:MAG: YncE family protein [Fimbriimonas sp.]|nr:YncE family protein [Fimbriimonas sp.]